jgi:hypothetical protein
MFLIINLLKPEKINCNPIRKVFMRASTIISMICLGIILPSCDRYNFIHYTVKNNTNDTLLLTYSFADSYFTTHASDTSIFVKAKQVDTLFIYSLISPYVYDPENESTMIYVSNLNIVRLRDNARIRKEVSIRKNWIYKETGRNSANLEFIINNTDF